MPGSILRLAGAGYRVRGRHLLRDLDIAVAKDSLTMVLGANGAGKSLFLQMCHGLIGVSGGTLQWVLPEGTDTSIPRQTMVFQKPVMLRRSVLENIKYALRRLPRQERDSRAAEALAWADIGHLADHYAILLSVGQQQQLALARAWATQPAVLFLDEPTASLDPEASDRVEGLIVSMHRQGTKVFMATHNLAQAQRVGDDVIFIHEGRINAYQQTADFFQAPATEEVSRFIKREVLLKE